MAAKRDDSVRVFVVDDHRLVLWGLEQLIEGAPGLELAGSATSISDAFARLERAAPDVIVLDLMLGNENGLDAMPELLARSKANVVVLTEVPDTAMHDKAVLAGARGVVEKGATPEMLLSAIRKVHAGELWVDRSAAGRILVEFSRQRMQLAADPERLKISKLTGREREIVAVGVAHAGASAKKIAGKLHITESTLRNHLTSIYDKLGVANRVELFSYAQKHGLVDPSR